MSGEARAEKFAADGMVCSYFGDIEIGLCPPQMQEAGRCRRKILLTPRKNWVVIKQPLRAEETRHACGRVVPVQTRARVRGGNDRRGVVQADLAGWISGWGDGCGGCRCLMGVPWAV